MVFLTQLILAALALAAPDGHRPGDFTIVGPGGGGAMFHPTISPLDPETVLVSCDMTGAYISHNGGKSWRMFNLRGVVEFFVFDPNDKNVIYAQATGLWQSSDNGETWKLLYPRASAIKAIKMDSDHSDEDIIADPDPLSTIFAMAIDPEDSRTFYVTAGNRAKGNFGVFISRDGGESWTKLGDLPDLREDHHALVLSGDSVSERYALVNVETDRITNSLNTLSEEALRWIDLQSNLPNSPIPNIGHLRRRK